MIGAIVAMCIAIWFYQTAIAANQKSVSWAIAGVIIYFMAALFWSYFITPSIKVITEHNQKGCLILVVQYAYIIFGLGCATVFKLIMTAKQRQE